MTNERFAALMNPKSGARLTQEEINIGWHYCIEWDGLLRRPLDKDTGYQCDCLGKTLKWHNPKRDK